MQIYLYQLRKEKGITQKELAQKLGISETAYRQKEKGQSAFTQDEMFFLRSFFDKPLQDIFYQESHQNGNFITKNKKAPDEKSGAY